MFERYFIGKKNNNERLRLYCVNEKKKTRARARNISIARCTHSEYYHRHFFPLRAFVALSVFIIFECRASLCLLLLLDAAFRDCSKRARLTAYFPAVAAAAAAARTLDDFLEERKDGPPPGGQDELSIVVQRFLVNARAVRAAINVVRAAVSTARRAGDVRGARALA